MVKYGAMKCSALIMLMACLAAMGNTAEFEDFKQYWNPLLAGGSISAATDGSVWIAAGASLAHFEPTSEKLDVFRIPKSGRVAIDGSGAIWVHCLNSIFRLRGDQAQNFVFGRRYGYEIKTAPDGSVWAALSSLGQDAALLLRFEGDTFEDVGDDAEANGRFAMALAFEDDGTAWLSYNFPYYIARLQHGIWQFFTEDKIQGGTSSFMLFTKDRELWLTDTLLGEPPNEEVKPVVVLRDGRLVRSYDYPEIAGSTPRGISQDHLGRIWIPDGHAGVSMFDGQRWTVFNTLNSGLPTNRVSHVAAGPDGSVWFTTGAGLARYQNGLAWPGIRTGSGAPTRAARRP